MAGEGTTMSNTARLRDDATTSATAMTARTTSAPRPSRMRDDEFGPQRTPAALLPAPEPLLRNLALGTMEILAGIRDVDQLARWLVADAYRVLVVRANLAARARSARGIPPARPVQTVRSVRMQEPDDGIVEGVVIVDTPYRTRAIALRLEGTDGRWRATSLALL